MFRANKKLPACLQKTKTELLIFQFRDFANKEGSREWQKRFFVSHGNVANKPDSLFFPLILFSGRKILDTEWFLYRCDGMKKIARQRFGLKSKFWSKVKMTLKIIWSAIRDSNYITRIKRLPPGISGRKRLHLAWFGIFLHCCRSAVGVCETMSKSLYFRAFVSVCFDVARRAGNCCHIILTSRA